MEKRTFEINNEIKVDAIDMVAAIKIHQETGGEVISIIDITAIHKANKG